MYKNGFNEYRTLSLANRERAVKQPMIINVKSARSVAQYLGI